MPFMKTDGVAGQAAAQMATKMDMNERVQGLHDHIASLKALFEEAQLESEDINRWDLFILHCNPFAQDRKVSPLDDGRRQLVELVERVDLGMKAIRESYMCLSDSVTHSRIVFEERVDSATTALERAFNDRPFRLQFHPTSHLAENLLQVLSNRSAVGDLEKTLKQCGETWADCELVALKGKGVDMLERVEKSHRTLVSRLHSALEEWEGDFKALAKPARDEAQIVKDNLVEWFVASCRRYLALTFAIGGHVSVGKSSLLNAVMGQKILPTDKVVETAVPCCIRHVAGRTEPILELPHMTPYTTALDLFRRIKLSGSETAPAYSNEQLMLLENLKSDKGKVIASRLYDPSYKIPEKVEGVEPIRELLALLNLVTRFSIILRDEIDIGTPNQWPLLTVEFSGLMAFPGSAAKLREISGHLQFLDCPGHNENANAGDYSIETDRFKRLMRAAALSADVVVPVISLPSLGSGIEQKQGFLREEWAKLISVIVVTKIQQKNVEPHQKTRLAEVVLLSKDRSNDIVPCDSLLGLGSLRLRDYLQKELDILSRFKDKEDPTSELNLYGLQNDLDSITPTDWSSIATRNLRQSRIESTFDHLMTYSIRRAQNGRLVLFDKLVRVHMRGLLGKLRQQMAIERATAKDLEKSQRAAADARKDMQVALQTWGRDNEKPREEYNNKVKERLKIMEKEVESLVSSIVKRLDQEAPRGRKGVIQWESQEQAQKFFEGVILDTYKRLRVSGTATMESVEELASLCRTELLRLLEKIAARKVTNGNLQDIINAKIKSLEEPTSVLRAEIREKIKKSGSNERWKDDDMTGNLVQQFVNAFAKKNWLLKPASFAKTLVSRNRAPSFIGRNQPSDQSSILPMPSSASSSEIASCGSPSHSRTLTLTNNTGQSASHASSSQQSFLRVPEPEPETTIGEIMTSRASAVGGSSALSEEPASFLPMAPPSPNIDCQDVCSSSVKLGAYISTTVVKPFLKRMKTEMTNLAETRLDGMEKVYEGMILRVMAEYEEAIKKEEDLRKRTPGDLRARSTLAQLQLWANVTAAVSAMDTLTKTRIESLQTPDDVGSPVLSPLTL